MTTIIGYTYEADTHCINCTRARFYASEGERDANQVALNAQDQEGNLVVPQFSSDEVLTDVICGTCGGIIAEM